MRSDFMIEVVAGLSCELVAAAVFRSAHLDFLAFLGVMFVAYFSGVFAVKLVRYLFKI